jgi:hypothetical protein
MRGFYSRVAKLVTSQSIQPNGKRSLLLTHKKLQVFQVFLFALLLTCQRGSATIYFQDGFNYSSGTQLGGNTPWISAHSGITVSSSGLSYAVGGSLLANVTSSSFAAQSVSGNTSGTDYGTTYASLSNSVTSGSGFLYCSFLLNVSGAQSQNFSSKMVGLMAGNQTVANAGSSTEAFSLIGYKSGSSPTISLQVASTGSPGASTTLTNGTVYFVVIKYNLASGYGYLFLNPTPGGTEPGAATITAATPSGSPNFSGATALGRFYLYNNYIGYSPSFIVDTLRIGSTWAEVTPATSNPGTLFVAEGFGTNYAVGSLTNQVKPQAGYTNGTLIGQNPAQAGFDGAWVGSGTATVQAVGLTYPGLGQADTNSAFLTGASKAGRAFLAGNNGPLGNYIDTNNFISLSRDGTSFYISFLMQVSNLTANASFGFYGDGTNLNQSQLAVVANAATTNFVLTAPGGVTLTNFGVLNTNLNLFVISINFKPRNDTVSVYVNPLAGTNTPSPTVTLSNVNLAFNALGMTCSNATAGVVFDEIRFGSGYASVASSNLLRVCLKKEAGVIFGA